MAAKKGVDFDKLMGMLECSICLERYENPKMLRCTHEFCKPCLEGILEFRADGSATIACPLRCKLHTEIGKQETLNDLAASFIAKNVLEAVSTEEEDTPAEHFPRCNAAPDCSKCVAMYCCEHLMCNSCYKKHAATSRDHKRTFRLDRDTRKQTLVVTCEKHVSKCTHVCQDGKLMCVYCLHRDPAHQNLCLHAKNNIEGVVSSLRRTLEKYVERQDRVERCKTLTLEQVSSVKKLYGEKIQARKLKLLKEYARFLDDQEEDSKQRIEILCDTLVRDNFGIDGAHRISLCKDVYQRGIDMEILIREKELQSMMKTPTSRSTLRTLHLSLGDSFGFLDPKALGSIDVKYGEISVNDSAVTILSFEPVTTVEEDCLPVLSHSNMLDSSSVGAAAAQEEAEELGKMGELSNVGAAAVLDEPEEFKKKGNSSGIGAASALDERKELRKGKSSSIAAAAEKKIPSSASAAAVPDKAVELGKKGKSFADNSLSNNQPTTSSACLEEPPVPPVDCHLLKAQGNEHFQKRKYKEAVECYSMAIHHADSNKSLAVFYQNRAAANEKLGRWNDVIGDCNEALNADTKYCKAVLRRARAYQSLGETRSAAEDYTRLYSISECSLQGCTHMNPNINDSTSYQKLMIKTIRSLSKEAADDLWMNRPMTFPSNVLVKTYLENTSNFDIFQTTLDVDLPEDRPYYQILESLQQNDFKEVVELCTKVIDSQSKHWERASLLRGSLRYVSEDPGNAHEDFSRVFCLKKTDGNIPLIIDAALRLADITTDLHFIEEAMKLDRRNAKIFCRKGRVHMRRLNQPGLEGVSHSDTEFAEACTSLRLAITLDPTYVAPRLSLAECLNHVGPEYEDHIAEANSVMEETVRLFPECSLAWCIYGNVLRLQCSPDRIQDAVRKLNRAISLDPSDPRPLEFKAEILGVNKCADEMKRAIKLKSSWALQSMALEQMKQGKINAALGYLKRIPEVTTNKEEAINALSLLEDLDLQTKFGYLRNKPHRRYHHELDTHSEFYLEMIERVMNK